MVRARLIGAGRGAAPRHSTAGARLEGNPRTRKAPQSGAFRSAPKRTRTSTRLSRTRPSTWRVYQFRHRRESGGEYSPGLSPSDGRTTVHEHMFAPVDQPAVTAI